MIHLIKNTKKPIVIPNIKILAKGWSFLNEHSFGEFFEKTKNVIERERRIKRYNEDYKEFLKENQITSQVIEQEKNEISKLNYQPKISILIPTYNSPLKFFKLAIESVLDQIYQNWELCIADDCSTNQQVRDLIKEYSKIDSRIKYIFRKKNGHISKATNSALKLATGEFIALFDHDDTIYPNTLSEYIKKINKYPNADLIYSDEDKINERGKRFEPHFKPNWSPETLLSGNYITHFAVIRKSIIEKINGFRPGYEGAQDFDLFLRISDITNNIYHISKVLYSWRTLKTSTASATSNAKSEYAYQNGVKTLSNTFKRRKIDGKVDIGDGRGLYRYILNNHDKKIDFFIIKNRSKFINKNLIKNLKKYFPKSNITYTNNKYIGKKIYEFINNSKADYSMFLDNQCFFEKETINTSIGFFNIKEIKMVSNKITNSRNMIYKTGLIVTPNKTIDAFYGISDGGYFNFNYSKMTKNYSAASLTGSTIDIKFFQKQNLNRIKTLDNLKDIGIFLSYLIGESTNRIVYNPNYPIIYKGKFKKPFESQKIKQYLKKILKKHKTDKNYNPNLTIKDSDFSIKRTIFGYKVN